MRYGKVCASFTAAFCLEAIRRRFGWRHKSGRARQPWGRHALPCTVTVLTPATDGQEDSPTARLSSILDETRSRRKQEMHAKQKGEHFFVKRSRYWLSTLASITLCMDVETFEKKSYPVRAST
jgi:hypothetical protein